MFDEEENQEKNRAKPFRDSVKKGMAMSRIAESGRAGASKKTTEGD
jgi:hypothetical protein